MNALDEFGRKLWQVDFMADYIEDIESRLPEEADDQKWFEEVSECSTLLRRAVTDLKSAVLLLPPEIAGGIAAAFHAEDEDAKARGAANCFLANVQREAGAKGGAA